MPATAIGVGTAVYGAVSAKQGQADAKKALSKGRTAGLADINAGEQAALGQYGQASQRLDPYAQGGLQGYNDYLSSNGINGADAQRAIEQRYLNDPMQSLLMDRIQRANTRRFTGIGMGNSGAATQSLTNAFLQNWGNYQNRLQGIGESGFNAANAQGGYDTHAGDTNFAAGQQRAAIDMGWANANAGVAGAGANNLINSLGAGVRAYGAMTGQGGLYGPQRSATPAPAGGTQYIGGFY